MQLFDFLKSDQQRVKDRIPGSMARLMHLIRISGPDAGPAAALRSLAINAANIRAGTLRGSDARPEDTFGQWIAKATKDLELTWWADRSCYMGMKESGSIKGGPDVPGLWDKEMAQFIDTYYVHEP